MNTRSLSTATVALGAAAVVLLLFLIFPPLADATEGLRTLFTVAFWVVAIALLVVLYLERKSSPEPAVEIQGPAFARFLFSDRRAGWFWLPIRLFLGIQWLEAGCTSSRIPAWMSGGTALRGYWERAAAIPEQGRPLITFEWYRDVLNWLLSINAEPWFAQLITFGEMAVGLGLIVGA